MGTYLIYPCTQVSTQSQECQQTSLKYSYCQMQGQLFFIVGWRRQMEDAAIHQINLHDNNALFAIFDGHGGNEVSKLVANIMVQYLKRSAYYQSKNYSQAFTEVFKQIDEFIGSPQGQNQLLKIRKQYNKKTPLRKNQKLNQIAGCTANVVLITPTTYVIANIGDSRSVLLRGDDKSVNLSTDHKPQNEGQKQRILNADGKLINGRVNGGLNLTRCFGDFGYKKNLKLKYDEQLIICKPDVRQFARVQGDKFILIGCDGIWEKYISNSQQLVLKIQQQRKSGKQSVLLLSDLIRGMIAKDLRQEVGCDNMTGILIQFFNKNSD